MIRKHRKNFSIRSSLPSKSGKKVIRIHSPHLHSGQLDIIQRRRRFNVVVCGRRFGKTVLIRSKHLIARTATERLKVGIFAPEFKDIAETWEKICKTLKPITTSFILTLFSSIPSSFILTLFSSIPSPSHLSLRY